MYKLTQKSTGLARIFFLFITTVLISACFPKSYTISGYATGVSEETHLQLNGDERIIVSSDGSFSFSTLLNTENNYNVEIFSPPLNQSCQLSHASGTITTDHITDITLDCTDHGEQWLMTQHADGFSITADNTIDCPSDSTFRGVVSLSHIDSRTVWFTDRPDRMTGHSLTNDFIAQWHTIFDDSRGGNPNAVIAWSEANIEKTIVVELANPHYDTSNTTLTYEVCGISTDTPPQIAGLTALALEPIVVSDENPIYHKGETMIFIDAETHENGPSWVMVQDASDIEFDLTSSYACETGSPFNGTMTLKDVDTETLWLTDRPYHYGAHTDTGGFKDRWDFLFSASSGGAPNAIIAWEEAGFEKTVAIELFEPIYEYNSELDTYDLSYSICGVPSTAPDSVLGVSLQTDNQYIPAAMPPHDGRITLFIDSVDMSNCAIEIPVAVPSFSCSDGELVPKTIYNHEGRQVCDKPEVLYNRCVYNSRIGRLEKNNNQGVDIVFSCRKNTSGGTHETDTSNNYYDIAVIQHNRNTGATCFYQYLGNAGENLPAPNTDAGRAFWNDPVDYCSRCHTNGPFVRTPHYQQVRDSDGDTVIPSIGSIDKYYLANQTSYQVFNVHKEGNQCITCHNIGAYTASHNGPKIIGQVNLVASGIYHSIGGSAPSPTPSTYEDFMVNYISAPSGNHREVASNNVNALVDCLASQTPVDCGVVSQRRAGVCPEISGEQCFWMENTSGNYCWVSYPSAADKTSCQSLDSCSPQGGGLSGGGCYKYAACSDCPAQP